MTKIRVNTNEMMKFVNGKRMEESDLCMFLEDLGVVLDRSTWTHFKDVFAQSKTTMPGSNKGNFWPKNKFFIVILENVPSAGPSSAKSTNTVDDADSEGSDKNNSHGKLSSKYSLWSLTSIVFSLRNDWNQSKITTNLNKNDDSLNV